MVELTIDGASVEVPEGSMVMHAANKLGVYVPHFCYHKKLSIAANCRMCLVEVEKAPKALPACATPVTNGMVVHTQSEKAVAAQQSVMEFLLINHPLDCPICDQGGECQLQDLAVGYGRSSSRYTEEKRVVFHKNLGPLVSAEEMQRCIHCTRCVRFGQEIAGVMELGMLNRGEHSEITSFVGRAIESELSGNMIDLCPVGALTSKPFRYSARTWELARRRSVSPHDSLNANIIVQVKRDRVLRVVPFENDEVNECWISDRDRFSYEGLNEDRLAAPMVRACDGNWHEVGWAEALQAVVDGLGKVKDAFGAGQIGALAAPYATTEEFSLLGRLVRALGSDNIDFRLRQTDPAFDSVLSGAPWLGMQVSDIDQLDRVLVIGSFLRADQPLITQRLRQAAKRGAQVSLIHVANDDLLMPIAARLTVTPDQLPGAVAQVAVALAQARSVEVPSEFAGVEPGEAARQIAESLAGASNAAIWLGSVAVESPQAATILANAQALANAAGAKLGFLAVGGNAVGGYLARAVPEKGGKNAAAMLESALKAYIILHAEPALDTANGAAAIATLKAAQFNVALTPYRSAAEEWAHVMLPVAPFTETSGTFVNTSGCVQSFKGTAHPYGQSRPAWKVLRVLGNALHLNGFDDETSEAVRDAALGSVSERLSNVINGKCGVGASAPQGLQRVADVPIYFSDAIVRRAPALQAAPASRGPFARMNRITLDRLGIAPGARVRVSSASGAVELDAIQDDSVLEGTVRVAAAHHSTVALGSAFGNLTVERV